MDGSADIRTVEVVSADEAVEMELKAKTVAEVLSRHYPNWPWAVGWAPGMTLVVKCLASPDRSQYGYTIDAAASFSATDLARSAMLAGGELLERMGVRRGAWSGELPTELDGADPRHVLPGDLLRQ